MQDLSHQQKEYLKMVKDKLWLSVVLMISSLVTITGDKFDHHQKCKGLDKPKCTRTVTAHGIKLEFVLPNDMFQE